MDTSPANPDTRAVAIAILAKAPLAGFAKTRLATQLGADGAAALQARFIERTVETARAAAVGPITLWAAPDRDHPVFQTLSALLGVVLKKQPEGDLGTRMLTALAGGPTLVIGTDCPSLTADHLRTAADVLRGGVDIAVIPVEDGGYALIGANRPEPRLFADMPWGTETVMTETRRRLVRLGLTWREPARLWDVDTVADLDRMRSAGLASLMG